MDILLHPSKRAELFGKGMELFNQEQFYEAHEVWEELWKLEKDRDKRFIQGLIQLAGHFVHLQKKNISGAKSLAELARTKLSLRPVQKLYREYDLEPLFSAIEYNLGVLLNEAADGDCPSFERFLVPKLRQA